MTNRRDSRALLGGLSALGALALVVLGLPALLLTVAGSPVPDQLPTLDGIRQSLTQQDDGTMALVVLQWAAWTCWAWFTTTVLMDVAQRSRGRAPLRGTTVANRLVGAVLAIAVAAPTAAVANEPAAPAVVVASSTAATASVQSASAVSGTVVVEPGDTLWDIAADELGDPYLWPEIADASDEVVQPDGQRLTDPDLIRPGWSLILPRDAAEPPLPTPVLEDPAEGPQVVTPLRSGSGAQTEPPAADQASEDLEVRTPLQAAEENWRAAGAAYNDGREPGADWRAALEAPFTGGL